LVLYFGGCGVSNDNGIDFLDQRRSRGAYFRSITGGSSGWGRKYANDDGYLSDIGRRYGNSPIIQWRWRYDNTYLDQLFCLLGPSNSTCAITGSSVWLGYARYFYCSYRISGYRGTNECTSFQAREVEDDPCLTGKSSLPKLKHKIE
jgi:hypothetical protein